MYETYVVNGNVPFQQPPIGFPCEPRARALVCAGICTTAQDRRLGFCSRCCAAIAHPRTEFEQSQPGFYQPFTFNFYRFCSQLANNIVDRIKVDLCNIPALAMGTILAIILSYIRTALAATGVLLGITALIILLGYTGRTVGRPLARRLNGEDYSDKAKELKESGEHGIILLAVLCVMMMSIEWGLTIGGVRELSFNGPTVDLYKATVVTFLGLVIRPVAEAIMILSILSGVALIFPGE